MNQVGSWAVVQEKQLASGISAERLRLDAGKGACNSSCFFGEASARRKIKF